MQKPGCHSMACYVLCMHARCQQPNVRFWLCAAGRLTGTLVGVRSIPSLPLSVEGQAHRLIGEATDKENLGSMYIWWMPWF